MKKRNHGTISLVPREVLERQALAMRKRARNEAASRKALFGRLLAVGSGMGGAYLTGMVMGGRVEANQPTDFGGIDMELVVGGGAALAGILLQAKAKASQVMLSTVGQMVEGGGMGILAYWAGSWGEKHGSEMAAAA